MRVSLLNFNLLYCYQLYCVLLTLQSTLLNIFIDILLCAFSVHVKKQAQRDLIIA